ncbi:MAG: hypothetical protein QM788_10225 [Roseateles sp.]|uniref:hypothetical protein n=1 Tax=Roseateles sp. TaxID=1971397 RepID=UPI0039EA97CB
MSNKRLSVNLLLWLTAPRQLRRARDLVVVLSLVGLVAYFFNYQIRAIIIGTVSGISAACLFMTNFSMVELTLSGASSELCGKINYFFRNSSPLIEVRPGEYADGRRSGLPHWKFDNIVVYVSGDGIIRVTGPLVYLKRLVKRLQQDGVKFQEDQGSSYRMI